MKWTNNDKIAKTKIKKLFNSIIKYITQANKFVEVNDAFDMGYYDFSNDNEYNDFKIKSDKGKKRYRKGWICAKKEYCGHLFYELKAQKHQRELDAFYKKKERELKSSKSEVKRDFDTED